MRGWAFWEWVAYACLFVAAVVLAADTGIKISPELAQHIPAFVGGSVWGFAPLFLVIAAPIILLMIRNFAPLPKSHEAPQVANQQTVYLTDINIASGVTPQTHSPVLLIGNAARTEQRLRIIVEHSHYTAGMGWGGWVSPQHAELQDLRDVYVGQKVMVAVISCSVPFQESTLMWGKPGGPPVHAIQKGKKYRALVRLIGADGKEQSPIRFLLRRSSNDEQPYIVDVTLETEFGDWPNMSEKGSPHI